MTRIICLLAFAACSVSEAKVPNEVTVELASVTLAENCTATTPPPPPSTFAKPPPGVAPVARGSCSKPGGCPSPARRRCEQTSMQLAITPQAGATPTTIKIKRVELLDKDGKLLETLTASSPTQWTDKGVYVAWDQNIPAGAVKASYALTAPNWNKYGGRMTAHTKTFQLRVTVTIGSSDRTVEKTSITPVRIEPMVVT